MYLEVKKKEGKTRSDARVRMQCMNRFYKYARASRKAVVNQNKPKWYELRTTCTVIFTGKSH